jgi:Amt family ammonium transporter
MKRKLVATGFGAIVALVVTAGPALAQESEISEAAAVQAVLDNLWLVIAGALVFLMQAGFAFVEAGLTRAKNIANIMAKNLADMAIGAVAFFVIGYSLAFGGGNDWWGGLGDFFLADSADPSVLNAGGGLTDNVTPAASFFFQVVFAATAVTIASGAMAERTKFTTYLIFSAVMTAIIYPIVVHWTWGGGLIAQMEIGDAKYSDFAGSTIVHLTGGVAAFMGAFFLGPRIGKYDDDGKPRAIPGHNIGYAVIGVFILWFGWFGFNAGSELAADSLVPFLALNTLLAAAAGVLGASLVIWIKSGVPDVAMAGNGALAGLVSITAPVGAVEPWAALVIGFTGGLIVVFAVLGFDRIRIDDPVGAIAVHGVCGIWGTLSIGLFARYDDAFLGREEAGLFYGGGLDQLAMQAVMVVIVVAWVGATTAILFATMKATIGLRVSAEEEMDGLDVREHGGPGYNHEMLHI